MENIHWQIPLWKMKITNEQYAELKQELHDAFISQSKQGIQALAKEAALYYAEWWRREYNGGSPSKEALAKTLGGSSEYSNEIYELAKIGGKKLNIPIIIRQNRLWFRSLLIQGGLPMHHIHNNKENIIVYKNFLTGLIRHAKSINVNWNDSSFIENLSCANYLPETFKNEGIFELSLLIARAIIEENDELLPYDAEEGNWRVLTTDLKESFRSESPYAIPFILRWRALKPDKNILLSFYIEFAKKISNSYIKERNIPDCYSFSLYVQNQNIATYVRTVSDDFICREKRFVNFKWKQEPVISLQLITNNNQIIDITAPNSFAPDFENPQLLVETDGYWNFKSVASSSNKNAIIFPQEWEVYTVDSEEVQLANNKLNWCEFFDFINVINNVTEEEICFNNTSTSYSCEFAGWSINWVQNANYKLLLSDPDIRLYNELGERERTKNVYYREYKGREWVKYQRGSLPIGLLEFKIELPDKRFIKEKFYNIGYLNCLFENMTQNSGEIKWIWPCGNVFPVSDQLGLKIEEKNTKSWKITRQNVLSHYPGTTKFRLFPIPNETNSPYLEIAVASPFKGVVLLNSHGEEVTNNQVICRTSMYGYRYIVMGHDVLVEVSHSQNKKSYITGQLKEGIHNLIRFDDNIREMFLLNGSDPFDSESKVKVKVGQNENEKIIYIKDYNLFSKKGGTNGSIVIIDNREDKNINNFQGQLYALTVDCPSEEIRVEELEKREDGFYLEEGLELDKFILFSDKFSDKFYEDQVVPRFFDFSELKNENIDHEKGEVNPQTANIIKIKKSLEATLAFSDDWNQVAKYFNIVKQYSLPFKTLNCFRAISQSPLLMAKMACHLWLMNIESQQELARYENELAVSYHWINEQDWNEAMDWLLSGMPESSINLLIQNVFENKKRLLNYTLNTETGELLNLLSNNNRNTIQVQHPTHDQIRRIRSKFGANKNLPSNLILIPDVWKELFPLSMDKNLPTYVKSLLLSPVKASLAMTGKDNSLWNEDENSLKTRRTINFYRQFLPDEYAEILLQMVKLIHQRKSNSKNPL